MSKKIDEFAEQHVHRLLGLEGEERDRMMSQIMEEGRPLFEEVAKERTRDLCEQAEKLTANIRRLMRERAANVLASALAIKGVASVLMPHLLERIDAVQDEKTGEFAVQHRASDGSIVPPEALI